MLRRLTAALALTALAAVAPASPAGARSATAVVGGAALATSGTVVRPAAGVPPLPSVDAASFVVADLDTGAILAARAPHARHLPASTLKTLTAVALIPQLGLGREYTPRFEDVNVEGSKVGVVEGHRYRVSELMRAMLMVSGNDAANCVAAAGGGAGGTARAIALMNATARHLQALDTHAVNANGLDAAGQVSSAYDLALFGRAGMQMPRFAAYVRTLRAQFPGPAGRFEIYNHNKLLTRYAGTLGIKGGYTVAARHSFVAAATRGGHRVLVTLMHAEQLYPDLMALLDWGFAADGLVAPVGTLVPPLAPIRATPSPAAAPAGGSEQPTATAGVRPRRGLPVMFLAEAGAVALLAGWTLALVVRARRRRIRVGDGLLRLP